MQRDSNSNFTPFSSLLWENYSNTNGGEARETKQTTDEKENKSVKWLNTR